jgi:hypothetical protein
MMFAWRPGDPEKPESAGKPCTESSIGLRRSGFPRPTILGIRAPSVPPDAVRLDETHYRFPIRA